MGEKMTGEFWRMAERPLKVVFKEYWRRAVIVYRQIFWLPKRWEGHCSPVYLSEKSKAYS